MGKGWPEFTEEDNYPYYRRSFNVMMRQSKYEKAYNYFKRLPEDQRQEVIKQDDFNFFSTLVTEEEAEIVNDLLINGTEKEQQQMQSVINKILEHNLPRAIQHGLLPLVRKCIEQFPGQESQQKIQEIVSRDNCAVLQSIGGKKPLAVVEYFLSREDTSPHMNAVLIKEKPIAQTSNSSSYFTRAKNAVQSILKGKQSERVVPTFDEQVTQKDNRTDEESTPSASDRSREDTPRPPF